MSYPERIQAATDALELVNLEHDIELAYWCEQITYDERDELEHMVSHRMAELW